MLRASALYIMHDSTCVCSLTLCKKQAEFCCQKLPSIFYKPAPFPNGLSQGTSVVVARTTTETKKTEKEIKGNRKMAKMPVPKEGLFGAHMLYPQAQFISNVEKNLQNNAIRFISRGRFLVKWAQASCFSVLLLAKQAIERPLLSTYLRTWPFHGPDSHMCARALSGEQRL